MLKFLRRDVKLENILIKHTKTGLVVKLADFGEASMFQVMNDFCGSLHYADPKILEHQPYNSKCDIWSLGICVFTLMTGHFPFDGANEDDIK